VGEPNYVSKRFFFDITLRLLGSAQKDLPKQAQSGLVSAPNLPRVSLPSQPLFEPVIATKCWDFSSSWDIKQGIPF
jgi:hypothetical protein